MSMALMDRLSTVVTYRSSCSLVCRDCRSLISAQGARCRSCCCRVRGCKASKYCVASYMGLLAVSAAFLYPNPNPSCLCCCRVGGRPHQACAVHQRPDEESGVRRRRTGEPSPSHQSSVISLSTCTKSRRPAIIFLVGRFCRGFQAPP